MKDSMGAVMRGTFFLLAFMAGVAGAQSVTYDLGTETGLLDSAFYAGESSDGSDVAGRFVLWGRPSNDGSQVAFIAVNGATFEGALFLVDVGDPSSWRRVTQDRQLLLDPMYWTPDGSAIVWGPFLVDIETGSETPHTIHGFQPTEPSMTRMAADNWMCTEVDNGNAGQVYLLPILPDGTEDLSRDPVVVTDALDDGIDTSWPQIAPDGSVITFSDFEGIDAGMGPDISDVWVLQNVESIRSAPKLPGSDVSSEAPTLASDPNLIPIRTSETDNFAHAMNFSENKSLILFVEDFNNVFNDSDFFNTLFAADFDIMVANADGSGADFRLQEPGNQAVPIPFPGGARFMFFRDVSGVLQLFASSLKINTSVSGNPTGDNDVETTTDQVADDGSGTEVMIPTGTTVDFPPTEPQEISITTPIDPVEEPALPPDQDAVAVVREFGPDGTMFNPPIEITISYTDAEIEGLDENSLTPYLFNEMTGVYDTPVPEEDIVSHDLVNNTITFQVDHFSTYGLAGGAPQPMPLGSLVVYGLLAGVIAGLGASILYQRRAATR